MFLSMNYVMVINAAVSLVMGCALVLVWRRDPTQTFTRYVGWANLIQLLVPLTYLVKSQGSPAVDVLGNYVLMVVAAAYSTLLLQGAADLADREVPKIGGWTTFLVLALVNAAAIGFGGPQMGQASMGTVNTLLGIVCTYWLWNAGATRFSSEKLVGPLLVLLGLIQFIYVVYQDAGAALLATLGALLRMMLGLVLLYAALDRGTLLTRKQQRRFEQLTERSHQGIMISLGDSSIVYANQACLAIYGVETLDQLQVATVARTIPKEERATVGRILSDIQHGPQEDASYEALRYRGDGTPLWLRFHYFSTEWDGAPAVQVLISDESDRHKAN